MKLSIAQVEEYLSRRFQEDVQVLRVKVLGDHDHEDAVQVLAPTDSTEEVRDGAGSLKTFGYGEPILVTFKVDERQERVVIHTSVANHFGHEERADRAAEMVLGYDTYNALPRHSQALDLGIIGRDNHLHSLDGGQEFFLLTNYAEGVPYARDLQRLRDTGDVTGLDLRRARQLALYLAEIHATKRNDPPLYVRRIRDTLGSGQGIMGMADSYPADSPLAQKGWLADIERECIAWRWRLKEKTHRLAQVHGDFHPFNVLFVDGGVELHLLDRSRGAWGEPADDVVCMAINYLFFSLQRSGKLAPPFEQLWNIFWNTYLAQSQDTELTAVAAPFFVWRALVLASPVWYDVKDSVRQALLSLAEAVLRLETFDPAQANTYIQ